MIVPLLAAAVALGARAAVVPVAEMKANAPKVAEVARVVRVLLRTVAVRRVPICQAFLRRGGTSGTLNSLILIGLIMFIGCWSPMQGRKHFM